MSDVDEECDSATVHGVTMEVSLVKNSSKVKYFTGKMFDGSVCLIRVETSVCGKF